MSNFVPVAMIIFEGAGDDLKTITVDFKVMPEYADQIRIITKVPEPAAILLFGTALCLFGFRRFR